MRFLTTLIATLLLASTSTLALKLPGNYTIIEVIPIEPEYMYNEAKDNPHVPLINATLRCGREFGLVYEIYTLIGYGWDGVTEQQLKHAAKQGGLMTKWYYFSWKKDECFVRESEVDCSKKPAGWEASFFKPVMWGRPDRMLQAFEKLTGMYGKDYTAVEYLMSNGTNQISSFTWEDYPEEGKLFNC